MSTSRWDAVRQMASRTSAVARRDDRSGARIVDHSDNDDAVALCAEVFDQAPTVRCVGRYTLGKTDFTVDTLERAGAAPGPPLEDVDSLSRELYDYMVRLNARLTGARTGALIRFFLSAGHGALHWNEISESQHLVALSITDATGEPAQAFAGQREDDRAVSALANRLRRQLRQLPRDYGGWLAEERDAAGRREPDRLADATAPVTPFVQNEGSSLATLCRDWLDPDDLHYASVFVDGEQIAVADILHHRGLRHFSSGTTPYERRRFYAELGHDLDDYSKQLDLKVYDLFGGELRYLVLDVERGAVFFHAMGERAYLVAVTLDQDRVATSESKVRELAEHLQGRRR